MVNPPRVSMLPDEKYPILLSADEFPTVPQLPPAQIPLPSSPAPSPVETPQVTNNDVSRSIPSTEPVVATLPVSSSVQAPLPAVTNDYSGGAPPNAYFVATSPVSSLNSSIPASSLNSSMPVSSLDSNPTLSRSATETNSFQDAPPSYRGDPTMFKGESTWRMPAFDSELLRVRGDPENPFWKQFNVWKVLVFGVLAFITGVVIATVVVNNNKAKSTTTATKPTGAAVTSTSNNTTSSSSLPITMASVASSGLLLQDGSTYSTQVFYQPSNSTSILYRMNLGNDTAGMEVYEQARNISLMIKPKSSTRMAATASTDVTGIVYLNVFYITSTNSIAQATLACPANSSKCRTTINMEITKGAQALHSESGLAAINVDNAQDWRIYYHNSNRNIVELAGNSSGFNTGDTIYSGTTLGGSYLTAVNVEKTENNINVFFVDHDSKALFYTQFTDSWQKALPVTSAVVNNWNPTSKLASAWASKLDEMRVYYVGTDTMISEFVGTNASSTNTVWEQQPETATTWTSATSLTQDITALAHLDQVRWWQYDNKTGLVEAALDSTNWVEDRVL